MIYIQVHIPDKNTSYDFKISSKISVLKLKKLILEAVYDIVYDDEFVGINYLFLRLLDSKKLENFSTISDYAVYDGEKFLLV